ncbi:MAG: DEAD/DEAH box helicase family protein [Candidatus Methanoperedens sp.]|nr:DEAD/DEAH box helicase family protein [Candidatus Methanoperedens sp.]
MLNPTTLLDLVRNFIIFEKSKKKDARTGITQVETEKKLAAYHQYYAVNKAVKNTIKAASSGGNRKGGVVWHTQGSGKSISMVFYIAKLVLSLNNPAVLCLQPSRSFYPKLVRRNMTGSQIEPTL